MQPNVESMQAGAPASETKVVQSPEQLAQAALSGARWFHWIAGLSLVNSAIMVFGGDWSFVVGLGATQIIDAIAMAVIAELGADAALLTKVFAFGGSALVAGVFMLFGMLAARRHAWAFVVGMIFYALDGMLFLLVGDWLSVGFHAFALFCIGTGFAANRRLAARTDGGAAQTKSFSPAPINP